MLNSVLKLYIFSEIWLRVVTQPWGDRLPMKNPGIRTLARFLSVIRTKQPTTRQGISNGLNRAYGMVNAYLKFSLEKRLIEVSKVEHSNGPWPQKLYVLTPIGRDLTKILESICVE